MLFFNYYFHQSSGEYNICFHRHFSSFTQITTAFRSSFGIFILILFATRLHPHRSFTFSGLYGILGTFWILTFLDLLLGWVWYWIYWSYCDSYDSWWARWNLVPLWFPCKCLWTLINLSIRESLVPTLYVHYYPT